MESTTPGGTWGGRASKGSAPRTCPGHPRSPWRTTPDLVDDAAPREAGDGGKARGRLVAWRGGNAPHRL